MHYVIELHYDARTEEKLREAAALCQSGGEGRPHITLTSSEGFDLASALPDLKKAFDKMPVRTVEISYLGLFPLDSDHKILYAGVSADRALCQLHEEIYMIAQKHSDSVFDL
jgi:2'-5' RNA ligase